ncbi:S10 family peptidase [Agaribacter flavus]|uniref:S10 family peptidase n=1 Tax=Agaribacter flavus TaxID=1902781 RepID=A0ABV7FY39_9ALTE
MLTYIAFSSALCATVETGNDAKSFTKEAKIQVGGKTLRYVSTAAETILRDGEGNPIASIWSVAYTKPDAKKENRPVTFIYNGGPGASSSVLHIGLLGPKIVRREGAPNSDDGAAPYALIDNPNSILDLTDLVFVDPVGTGYSHALGDKSNQDFWSVGADARSMGDFIRQWIADKQRWNAPKHILGLSYGTTRAVGVAHYLHTAHGIDMNSLLLLGPALDLGGLSSVDNNLLAYIGYLPSMATVAHYHGKAGQGKPLGAFAKEAREFALNDYAGALFKGNMMSDEERSRVIKQFADFTGLEESYVSAANLRVLVPRFRKELLRKEGLTIGYSDGRYTGDEFDDTASDPLSGDPSMYKESGMYAAGFHHYMTQLGVTMPMPYKLWNSQVGKDWDWRPDVKAYADPQRYRVAKRANIIEVASKLGTLMRRNEALEVFAASGLYDIVTPFFDTERTFANHGIIQDRVALKYYESGHRLWADIKSWEALSADIRQFYLDKQR